MTVDADEPGRRLILTAPLPILPKRWLAGIGGVMLAAFCLPAILGLVALARSGLSTGRLLDVAFTTMPPIALAVVLISLRRRSRAVKRIAFDHSADRIEMIEIFMLGGAESSPGRFRITDLRGMTLRAATQVPRGSIQPAELRLSLKLQFREGSTPAREVAFAVQGLDRKEEAGDLALRLARIAGLGHQRVIRNDPREIEIALDAAGGPGFTRVTETEARADYDRNQTVEAAKDIAATQQVPRFDPATLKSDHRLERWEPGVEVRFRKPMGFATIGCAPGLLLFLLGPWDFIQSRRIAGWSLGMRLGSAALEGVFGVFVGGLSLLIVTTSAAHTVVFDWAERRLRVRSLFSRPSYDFSSLRAIQLEARRTKTRHGGGSCYCRINAQIGTSGAEPETIELLQTAFSDLEDPDTPYRMALPLVTELAAALGVPRVVTDYKSA